MSTFSVKMRTHGNPDFGQYAPISEPDTFEADTLEALRAKVRGYIGFWSVGGGNWPSPVVYKGGKRIGYLSYNLRLWAGARGSWTVSDKPIDEPTGHIVEAYNPAPSRDKLSGVDAAAEYQRMAMEDGA
jgi:hypothetical protein